MSAVGGGILAGVAVLYKVNVLDPMVMIIGLGIGLYTIFTPLCSIMIDRLLGASGTAGTAVFLIYFFDFVGYVGTTGLLLFKGLYPGAQDLRWSETYIYASICVGILAAGLNVLNILYLACTLRDKHGKDDYSMLIN